MGETVRSRSINLHGMPRRVSKIAASVPTGPAPLMRTGISVVLGGLATEAMIEDVY